MRARMETGSGQQAWGRGEGRRGCYGYRWQKPELECLTSALPAQAQSLASVTL